MNWLSRLIALFHRPAPPTRKPRQKMGHVVCRVCDRTVAYSMATQRTALHACLGVISQVAVGSSDTTEQAFPPDPRD